jgi:hypothetical protein
VGIQEEVMWVSLEILTRNFLARAEKNEENVEGRLP